MAKPRILRTKYVYTEVNTLRLDQEVSTSTNGHRVASPQLKASLMVLL